MVQKCSAASLTEVFSYDLRMAISDDSVPRGSLTRYRIFRLGNSSISGGNSLAGNRISLDTWKSVGDV